MKSKKEEVKKKSLLTFFVFNFIFLQEYQSLYNFLRKHLNLWEIVQKALKNHIEI